MKVEFNSAYVSDKVKEGTLNPNIMITPAIGTDGYWLFKVRLTEKQAIIAFPKFFTLGIGFLVEEDWNTNLPYSSSAEEIFNHISHNKGDDNISDTDCIAAIEAIRAACKEYMEAQNV